jgi:hypothetical protein
MKVLRQGRVCGISKGVFTALGAYIPQEVLKSGSLSTSYEG